MLDAAQEAQAFVQGKTRASLDDDRGLVLILIQEIVVIGEAASKVTEECRSRYSQIPWSVIKGMRNRLIHAYFDVDIDTIWNTVSKRIP